MLNVFEELNSVKEDEVVDGTPVDVGGVLVLVGFIIVTIYSPT